MYQQIKKLINKIKYKLNMNMTFTSQKEIEEFVKYEGSWSL